MPCSKLTLCKLDRYENISLRTAEERLLHGVKIAPSVEANRWNCFFLLPDTVGSAKIVFGRRRSEIPAAEGAAVWWFNG
jgi:hypothetical protein